MRAGWHTYAQQQPAEVILAPTSFKYVENPFLAIQGPVKTLITGMVIYRACTDKECLRPAAKDFTIALPPPGIGK